MDGYQRALTEFSCGNLQRIGDRFTKVVPPSPFTTESETFIYTYEYTSYAKTCLSHDGAWAWITLFRLVDVKVQEE